MRKADEIRKNRILYLIVKKEVSRHMAYKQETNQDDYETKNNVFHSNVPKNTK